MPVAASTRTPEEQIDLITLYLTSGHPNLLIVATNDREAELAVAEEARSRAGINVKIEKIVLSADSVEDLSLSHQLTLLPAPKDNAAVFVFGLDDLTEDARTTAINAMNWGRERLRYAGYSVVLWVRAQTPGELGNRAPDFYSWRSDVFEFDLPSNPVDRERMLARWRLFAPSTLDALRTHYLDYVKRSCGWLDSRGLLQVRNVVRLHLDAVFIPLQVVTAPTDGPAPPNIELSSSGDPRELPRYEGRAAEPRLEIAEALGRYQRLVVLGDPGSGKSTLLRFLALKFAQGDSETKELLGRAEDRLPILIPVSSYSEARRAQPELSLAEFLPRFFRALALPDLSSLFDDALRTGNVLFLLDGLDEVLTYEDRAASCQAIADLAASNPEARIIVTSRIAGFSRAMLQGDFAVSTILPFDDEDIKTFAERWSLAFESAGAQSLEALPPDVLRHAMMRADNLTSALTAHPGLKRLATNPLLLTLLALIQHQGARLPHRRVDVYRLCIEALAETWNLARSLGEKAIDVRLGVRRLDEEFVIRILGPVAFWMHETSETGTVARKELKAAIGQQFISSEGVSAEEATKLAQAFLLLAREQTGLLVEVGLDEFRFLHLSFQEYLAARFLSEAKDGFEKLKPRLHHPRWREIVLLTAASLRGDYAADFIEKVLNAHEPFKSLIERSRRLSEGKLEKSQVLPALVSLMDLLLAAECICDCATVKFELRESVQSALLNLWENPPFKAFRDKIVQCFSYLEGGEFGDHVLRKLLQVLRDKSNEATLRALASETAARIAPNSPEVISALTGVIEDRAEDTDVRAAVARALAQVPPNQSRVVEILLGVLEDRSDPNEVRAGAAQTLGVLRPGDERIVAGLLSIAMDESEDQFMRYDSISALSQATQTNAELTDALLNVLLNKRVAAWVRTGAAFALSGRANDSTPSIVSSLVRILEDTSEDARVRWWAAFALGEVSKVDSDVAAVLLRIARNSGDIAEVRASALLSTDATNPSAARLFLEILRDTNADTTLRSYAALKLWHAALEGDGNAISALLSVLRDDNEIEAVRGHATLALGFASHGLKDVIETLLEALPIPGFRDNVLDALWRHLQFGKWPEPAE